MQFLLEIEFSFLTSMAATIARLFPCQQCAKNFSSGTILGKCFFAGDSFSWRQHL